MFYTLDSGRWNSDDIGQEHDEGGGLCRQLSDIGLRDDFLRYD